MHEYCNHQTTTNLRHDQADDANHHAKSQCMRLWDLGVAVMDMWSNLHITL